MEGRSPRQEHRGPSRRFVVVLLAIGFLALCGRTVYVIAVTRHEPVPGLTSSSGARRSFDEIYYVNGANAIVDGDGFFFSELPGNSESLRSEQAEHPPFTNLAFAAAAWVGDRSELAMRLEVAFVGALVVLLLGLLARELVDETTGLVAAGLGALYPFLWVSDGLLLSETFAVFWTTAAMYGTYRMLERPTWPMAALTGAAVGLAMLTRAELMLLVLLLFLPAALALRSRGERRWLWVPLVAAVVAVALAVPWVGYNLSRFERPVTLSYAFGGVLAGSNCDDTYAGSRLGYWNGYCARVETTGDASIAAAEKQERGLRYMRGHLDRLPIVVAARVGRTWGLYAPFQMARFAEAEGRPLWASLWGWVMSLALIPLGIVGAIGLRRLGAPLWPLVAPLVVVLLTGAAFGGLVRHRAVGEPSLVVLGAVAVVVLTRHALPHSSRV